MAPIQLNGTKGLPEALHWASHDPAKRNVWIARLTNGDVRAVVRYLDRMRWCIYDPLLGAGYFESAYPKYAKAGIAEKTLYVFTQLNEKSSDLEIIDAHIPPFGRLGAPRVNTAEKRRYEHTGIDIYGPVGTPLWTPSDGKVIVATYVDRAGKLIEVNGDFYFRFLHCDSYNVDAGAHINKGETIGTLGMTGNARFAREWVIKGKNEENKPHLDGRSHLHLEARDGGQKGTPFDSMKLMVEGKIGLPLDATYLR